MRIKKFPSESDQEPNLFGGRAYSETSSPLKVESPAQLEEVNTKELAQDKSAEQIRGPEEQEEDLSKIVPMIDPIRDLDQSINLQ